MRTEIKKKKKEKGQAVFHNTHTHCPVGRKVGRQPPPQQRSPSLSNPLGLQGGKDRGEHGE